MTTRPSLTRSIPFWGLLAVSVASAAVGAWVVVDKTTLIETALVNGTQTGVEIYAGQPLVVLGAILVGAGVLGILTALGIATAASLRPTAAVEVVEPLDEIEATYGDAERGGPAEVHPPVDAGPEENLTATR